MPGSVPRSLLTCLRSALGAGRHGNRRFPLQHLGARSPAPAPAWKFAVKVFMKRQNWSVGRARVGRRKPWRCRSRPQAKELPRQARRARP